MQIFAVGDVHGCYHTFKELLTKYWDPENSLLVQVGDLIQKGKHSGMCVAHAMQLGRDYPGRTVFLKGNHEYLFLKYCGKKGGNKLTDQAVRSMEKAGLPLEEAVAWLKNRPLKWENDHILITHAGIAKSALKPYREANPRGVLFNRSALRSLSKVQIHGHYMLGTTKPMYKPQENAWNIDTGAGNGKYLSALLLNERGERLKVYRLSVVDKDF